jgi:hypothetical protein
MRQVEDSGPPRPNAAPRWHLPEMASKSPKLARPFGKFVDLSARAS